jgi:hypothetical protein
MTMMLMTKITMMMMTMLTTKTYAHIRLHILLPPLCMLNVPQGQKGVPMTMLMTTKMTKMQMAKLTMMMMTMLTATMTMRILMLLLTLLP